MRVAAATAALLGRAHSLRGRFLVAVALLLLAFAGTTAALAAQRESASLLAELQRIARGTAQLMAPTATDSLARGRVKELQQGLRAVRAQEGVVDAYVLDPAGVVLADGAGGRPEQRHLDDVRGSGAVTATEPAVVRHGSTLDAVWPLELSGERLGSLVVGFSTSEVEEAARTSRDRHLLTGLLFALVGLVLTWLLVRGVTRRLQQLTTTAQVHGLVRRHRDEHGSDRCRGQRGAQH